MLRQAFDQVEAGLTGRDHHLDSGLNIE